ncbi:transcription antiterminator LicT [Clostridium disporicum]|jgi:transcriptional antiterminator|uniref:Transcription antiterminator LicT n=1 Tax=Clostridium disporicum TaxID=84024 RepID=A0A174HU57_9CLOT|nr:transcription antiterminator LicT [Clostridium disporicum]
MGIVLTNDTIVSKVLNNNIILVRDKSVEKILFCRGIGFNKKVWPNIRSWFRSR